MRNLWIVSVLFLWLLPGTAAQAQTDTRYYDAGQPVLTDVWVNPAAGSDSADGLTAQTALATLSEAWNRIPQNEPLAQTGYRIRLMPGRYPPEAAPNYWEHRYDTYQHPIWIEAAEGAGTVFLPSINLFDSRFVYFINLTLDAGVDAFHCERCDHVLLRGDTIIGAAPDTYAAQETVKVNQSQNVFIEDSDISGAWNVVVDFVAVQGGHVQGNRIHSSGDWCMYFKGGSASIRVEGNILYDCGNGGFSAGQGTGFQFMLPPYIQYEAYDITFVNNIVHHTNGAGVGVQGGYNIRIAYNTFYHVGANSHVIEMTFGSRSCDGQPGDEGRERCAEYAAAGGWGNEAIADGENYVRIPSRHVYIYNNLILNPPGMQSQWQQMNLPGTFDNAALQTGAPNPVQVDEDLQIVGNLIWNGPADHPLGMGGESACQPDNPTCNETQLRANNRINAFAPALVDPENGNFRPADAAALAFAAFVPPFSNDDRPAGLQPLSDNMSELERDFDGQPRQPGGAVGAFGG